MARLGLDWIGLGWNGSGMEWARTGLETRLGAALGWTGLVCIGLEWIGLSWNGFGFDRAHVGLEIRLEIGLDLDLGWTREWSGDWGAVDGIGHYNPAFWFGVAILQY